MQNNSQVLKNGKQVAKQMKIDREELSGKDCTTNLQEIWKRKRKFSKLSNGLKIQSLVKIGVEVEQNTASCFSQPVVLSSVNLCLAQKHIRIKICLAKL